MPTRAAIGSHLAGKRFMAQAAFHNFTINFFGISFGIRLINWVLPGFCGKDAIVSCLCLEIVVC